METPENETPIEAVTSKPLSLYFQDYPLHAAILDAVDQPYPVGAIELGIWRAAHRDGAQVRKRPETSGNEGDRVLGRCDALAQD